MGKLTYKYIDPPRGTDKATELFRDTLIPLMHTYWEQRGEKLYGAPFHLNIVPLVQSWMGNSLVLIVAYDDGAPVGFLFGVKFVPMLYNAVVLQAEVFYGPTEEVEKGMITYLSTIIPFMNVNELRVNTLSGGSFSLPGWQSTGDAKMLRYVKE